MVDVADLIGELGVEEISKAIDELSRLAEKHGANLLLGCHFTACPVSRFQTIVLSQCDPLIGNSLASLLTDVAMDDMSQVAESVFEGISKGREGGSPEKER